MPKDVLMPQLSPTMTEGRLSKWTKSEGDDVKVGMIIAEVETDKATMEVEAVADGKLAKIIMDSGQDIDVGTPIAIIAEDGEEIPEDYEPKGRQIKKEENSSSPSSSGDKSTKTKKSSDGAKVTGDVADDVNFSYGRDGYKASPLARKLAAQWGVPLALVEGTGPDGRIVKADIIKARENGVRGQVGTVQAGSSEPEYTFPDDAEVEPHSKMREIIAGRLQTAKQTVPHFYLTVDVEMDDLLAHRAKQNDGVSDKAKKITVNDYIIKACALALKEHPKANASWSKKGMVSYNSEDISVAVATDNGLITPIIKEAGDKKLADISSDMKALAAKAKDGKLKPEEYQGGSFSVSNLGMFGIKQFDAIINPPQAAILAVGAASKRPVIKGDDIKVATVMTITMSVDHRVIDGALGAELLTTIVKHLEDPEKIVS